MPAARRTTRPLLTNAQLMEIDRLELQWRGTIGANVRKARKAAQLSQEELAAMSDISRQHISLIEHGKWAVTIDSLVRIAFALRTTPAIFLVGE